MKLVARLFLRLLVLLAITPEACPQTGLIPPPGSQVVTRRTGNSRNPPAQHSIAETSPILCFQPGVGWQRNSAWPPDGSVTREASAPAGAADPPPLEAKVLNSQQAHPGKCGAMLIAKKQLGAAIEAAPSPSRTLRTSGSAKPVDVTSFPVYSLFLPKDRHGLGPVRTMSSALPPATTTVAQEGSGGYRDQGAGRRFRAYVSPVQLRRLIRNARDFRIREKLAQLGNSSDTKSRRAKADPKTGHLARKQRPGIHKRRSHPCGDPMRTNGSTAIAEIACHP